MKRRALNTVDDFSVLRELLASWNLLELLQLFQDEGINVEELQMMKSHHIAKLLQHHKMGIIIRFEHHLETWRRNINNPLQPSISNCILPRSHLITNTLPSTRSVSNQTEAIDRKNRSTNTIRVEMVDKFTNTAPSPLLSPMAISPNNDFFKEMPKLTPQPHLKLNDASNSISTHCNEYNEPDEGEPPVVLELYDSDEEEEEEEPKKSGALLQILLASGSQGKGLIDYYKKHHELTNSHRTMLIHIIVEFFEINKYHLSLNLSHNLEMEILRMFPTEKLEYYRTEKRGKIYVKFCNAKRYKRDKSGKKRKWEGWEEMNSNVNNTTTNTNDVGDEDNTMNFDNWPQMQSNCEMQVKVEKEDDN